MGMTTAYFPVAKAEELLNVTFHTFRNLKTKGIFRRALDGVYSLPASIASIVSHVEGVRRLPKITNVGLKQLPKNGKRIGLAVTPKVEKRSCLCLFKHWILADS